MFISTFQADVTPPLGSPLCGGYVKPAIKIVDPLSVRGLVLFTDGQPIVLCAVDWTGICNESYDLWCEALAKAAGTSKDRVTVHTLHPHDAPYTNRSLVNFLKRENITLNGRVNEYVNFEKDALSLDFETVAIERVAQAVRLCLNERHPVSHISIGKAEVHQFASNRRIIGKDGKVAHVRFTSCRDANVRAMPEGTIDPFVRSVGLWNEDQPLVSMSWYASHPQSFYNRGAVSCDTVGLARGLREASLPVAAHIHFCGAGGNIGAGKYNDGSPGNRFELANRLATGMAKAWDDSVKIPIQSADVEWRTLPVQLPLSPYIANNMESIKAIMNDAAQPLMDRGYAAQQLSYAELVLAGRMITLSCLKIGPAHLLHLPGEMFVEYQLAAQAMRPEEMVCMAAYGDDGPTYIGTEKSYEQGGYECEPRCTRVAPEVEQVLLDAMQKLLI